MGMVLSRLQLFNFRSYGEQEFNLSEGVNLVIGPNASGKTNFLESLYVLASTKSFRGRDKDLISHNQNYYRIVGSFNEVEYALAFVNDDEKTQKQITWNGVKKTLSGHVGQIQAVLFEPGDLGMVAGAPEIRRRYLDFMLCQTNPNYLQALSGYRRVLKQRNSLLANFDTSRIKAEIFVWDIKLTQLAEEIYKNRIKLLKYLNPRAQALYSQIAASDTELELNYKPSVEAESYADNFMTSLATRLTADLAAGFTTIGPHREDFGIQFKGRNITSVASRGETRTAVLALKLAELEYCEEVTGIRPLLLLDDVFSELDHRRRRDLVKRLQGYQTVITATEAEAITGDIEAKFNLIRTADV